LILLFLLAIGPAIAADGPRPPCSGDPVPAYAAPGAKPNWKSWSAVSVDAPCVANAQGTFDVVVALAGSFVEPGGPDRILERLGAVSSMTGIRYYSQSHGDSRQMIAKSVALRSPKVTDTGSDFAPAKMKSGEDLHYAQSDPVSGNLVVYRMRVAAPSPDSITVEVENVTPIRMLLITVFEPRALRTVHFLRQRPDGVWNYYLLTLVKGSFAQRYSTSIENRALALFRYVAGQPTHPGEPLAAR
jgi:hypothetical protein